MQLSKHALQEFKVLWEQNHPNEDISDDELLAMATRVITAIEIIWKN